MPPSEPAGHIGPDSIGRRVSVRLLAGGLGPSGGPAMRDVVGVLEAITATRDADHPDHWVLRRKDGSKQTVSLDLVVAARIVPDLPQRLRTAKDVTDSDLEQIAAAGWQPLTSTPLGAWLLRASGGFTGRANSVLPLGDPGLPIDEALVQVTDWYERRGLPTRFQVPLPLATELDNDLDERGWIGYNPTLVMVADIADVLLNTSSKPHLAPVTFAGTPDSAWLDTYSYRGQPLPPYAYEVMVKADDPVFAGVPDTGRDDGAYLAVSRGAITGHWLGVTAVDVEVRDRRRGLATHIMRALFEYSYARGVRHVYLQVAEENDAARALYGGLGFSLHHRYHYRIASIESKP